MPPRSGFFLPVLTAIVCAVAISACGSSTGAGSASAHVSAFIKFSACMRSHGVPGFPDPSGGGGIHITLGSGVNPQSPSFQSAQTICNKLLPGGGPGNQHPTERDKKLMLQTSECMRSHGVTGFPDPTLVQPTNPRDYSAAIDRGGVILLVPKTIDVTSPVFRHAAAACSFPG